MRSFILFGFLFTAILWECLFCHKIGSARTNRPVKYEYNYEELYYDSTGNKIEIRIVKEGSNP